MLRDRVLTALALAVPLVWVTLAAPLAAFTSLIALILVLAAWEWARLAGLRGDAQRAAYVVCVAIVGAAALAWQQRRPELWAWLGPTLVLWLLFTLALGRLGRMAAPLKAALGVAVLTGALLATTSIAAIEGGRRWVLWMFVLVWVADIAAYFGGRRFGRVRLAPSISPGKTREGLYAALVGGVIAALVAKPLVAPEHPGFGPWIGLAIVVVLISVVGDLTESAFKRAAGLKDSGAILPGHGGVLDRIDSVLAAAPVMAAGAALAGLR